jgi:hypothetical protein
MYHILISLLHVTIGLYLGFKSNMGKDKVLLSIGILLSLYHLNTLYMIIMSQTLSSEAFRLRCKSDETHLKKCYFEQDDEPKLRENKDISNLVH